MRRNFEMGLAGQHGMVWKLSPYSILEAQENMKDISKTHSWPGFQSPRFGQNWIAASRFSIWCNQSWCPELIIFIHIQIISSIRDFHVSVHFLWGS